VKKKIILTLLCAVVIVFGLIMLWPLPFSNGITNDTELWIQLIDIDVENGLPNNTVSNYRIQSDSEEYILILQILGKYSFHRSFRTFFSDTSINGNNAGFWLHLYSGEKQMISGGTGEVIINNRVYRIGWFGNKKALSLMNNLRSILDSV
jgi:hypothetical protein